MTINLITPEEYARLLQIQKDFPLLTFENNGYEYISKNKLSEEDKKAHEEVTDILKKSIVGFSEFNNFKTRFSVNKLAIRFQYDWTADVPTIERPFTGVGYLLIEQLLNGFGDDKTEPQ